MVSNIECVLSFGFFANHYVLHMESHLQSFRLEPFRHTTDRRIDMTLGTPGIDVEPTDVSREEKPLPERADVDETVASRRGRKRLQLEMSEITLQQLNALVQTSGCDSLAEFGRRALRFYALVLDYKQRGYSMQFVKDAQIVDALDVENRWATFPTSAAEPKSK